MHHEPIISTVRAADGSRVTIEYHDKLESTVELAKKYAAEGYSDRYAIVTPLQSSSKITGTRLKDGEFERGIFISCLLRPSMFASQAGLLGHISAVSLLTALESHTTKHLGLGWISDIYCDGERIGGCSTLGKLDNFSTYEYLIVSFGVRLNGDNFPPRLTDMIKKVFDEDVPSLEMLIAKEIINRFFLAYSGLRNPGKYMDIYSRRFILREKTAKYITADKKSRCKILDVDKDSGALIIELSGKPHEVKSQRAVIMPKKVKINTK